MRGSLHGEMQGRRWLIGGGTELASEGGNGGAAESGVRARESAGVGIYRHSGLREKGNGA